MLSLEGIIRAKGGDQKPYHQPLPLVAPIPEYLRAEYGLLMTSWLITWYHRDQEEKKSMRVHIETIFNNLLDIKAFIGK